MSRGRAVRRFRVPRRLAGRARRAPDRRDSGHQAGASVRRASRGRKGRARCDVPRVQRVHGTTGIHRAVRADAVHVPPLGRRAVVGVRRRVRGRRQNKARLLQPAGRFVGGDDRVVLRAGRRASPPVAAAAGAASTPVHGDVQPLFAAAAAAARAAAPAARAAATAPGGRPALPAGAAPAQANVAIGGGRRGVRGLCGLHRRGAERDRGVQHARVSVVAAVGRLSLRERSARGFVPGVLAAARGAVRGRRRGRRREHERDGSARSALRRVRGPRGFRSARPDASRGRALRRAGARGRLRLVRRRRRRLLVRGDVRRDSERVRLRRRARGTEMRDGRGLRFS